MIRACIGINIFDFLVIDNPSGIQIDQKHLAGLQTPFLDDMRLRNRQDSCFGSHDDQIVIRHDITGRTKAISVQNAPDLSTIGESNGSGTIPGFHHGRMIFIKGTTVTVHQLMILPCLRNHHHHGMGQRIARHDQKFQCIVETCGIGLAFIHQRIEFLQIVSQNRRTHHLFTGTKPVEIALDRINFTVMRNQAIWVSERPLRKSIRGKTLMHHRQCGNAAFILQIEIIVLHLIGQQQSLIHNRSGRHRRNEKFLAVFQIQRLNGMPCRLANDKQFSFQRIGHHDIRATTDKNLADDRFLFPGLGRHGHFPVHRNIPPSQNNLFLCTDSAFDFLFAGQSGSMFFRQKYHANPIFSWRRQHDSLSGHFFPVKPVWYLDQNARPVSHHLVGADCSPMIEIFQNQQPLFDNRMTFDPLDMGHESDTTGIMLERRTIQTLRTHMNPIHFVNC